jgi:hypothetical protein
VRAKTGTLNGVSCLSGYVGDQSDLVVFSIMVEGLRPRAVNSVRGAQVSAVNAMMRYARGTLGPAPAEEAMPTQDLETDLADSLSLWHLTPRRAPDRDVLCGVLRLGNNGTAWEDLPRDHGGQLSGRPAEP